MDSDSSLVENVPPNLQGSLSPSPVSKENPQIPLSLQPPPLESKHVEQEAITDGEWQEIMTLGKKSFFDLTNNPVDAERLKILTDKGKGILGEKFGQELTARQQQEQEKLRQQIVEKDNRQNDVLRQMEDIVAKARSEMDEIKNGFNNRVAKRQQEMDEKIRAIRQGLDSPNTVDAAEEILGTMNNPKMQTIKTELAWLDLMAGKPMKGIDSKLMERLTALKQDPISQIMKNPQDYERRLQEAKGEFYRSRGVDLQNQPKTSSL